MSRPFEVQDCASCGHAVFPPRNVCPRCAARDWKSRAARHGVVEERTYRFHRTREARRKLVVEWLDLHRVPIAFVRTDAGPVVVAWSPDDAALGDPVLLEVASGAPVARLP